MAKRFQASIGLLALCTVLFSSLATAAPLAALTANENSFLNSGCLMLFDMTDRSVKQASCDLPVTFNVFQQEDAKVMFSAEQEHASFATGVPQEMTHIQELPQEISSFVQSSFAFYSSLTEELSKCSEEYCAELLRWTELGADHATHFVTVEHDVHVILERRRKFTQRNIYIGCGEHGGFALIESSPSTRGNFGAISAKFIELTKPHMCDLITANM